MRFRTAAPAVPISLVVLIAACESDLTTTGAGSHDLASQDDRPETSAPSANSEDACPNCTFGPTLYTRATGIPVTEAGEFGGNPAGAYTLETDDLETRGAESRLWLNGERMKVRPGLHQQDVVLEEDNSLEVRLTGKPGSKLRVRIFQEVETVEVTPEQAEGRIQTSQQFTAVALDRNGVEIPTQTFTWESGDPSIATVGTTTGLARTVGEVHDTEGFSYTTTSLGEGSAEITAHADASDKHGIGTWTVVHGFVYTTYRAPPPHTGDPLKPFRYDEARLSQMASTCSRESSDTEWWDNIPLNPLGERQFKRCYPSVELTTPRRNKLTKVPTGPQANVGLYGRYCGGGHPDRSWMDDARSGDYQPRDPIDALCMEHDVSEDHHDIPASQVAKAACIVRYGIESDELHYEGVRVPEGSDRWNEFWDRWPDMAGAWNHWIVETTASCFGPIYTNFLEERGLARP